MCAVEDFLSSGTKFLRLDLLYAGYVREETERYMIDCWMNFMDGFTLSAFFYGTSLLP